MDRLVTQLFNAWSLRVGVDGAALDYSGMAAFEIGQGIIVNFQAQLSPPVLTLFAVVASLPAGAPAGLLRDMLEANLLWGDTGGATLSLQQDEDNGAFDVVVAQKMAVHKGTAVTELERMFDNICLVALDWKVKIEQDVRDAATPDPGSVAPGMPLGALLQGY